MAFFGGRLFVVGHDVKNRVSFSHIDPKLGYAVYDYFPAINFFDVASNENDEIVGLVTFRIVYLSSASIPYGLYMENNI